MEGLIEDYIWHSEKPADMDSVSDFVVRIAHLGLQKKKEELEAMEAKERELYEQKLAKAKEEMGDLGA